jgi:hypothetical protein
MILISQLSSKHSLLWAASVPLHLLVLSRCRLIQDINLVLMWVLSIKLLITVFIYDHISTFLC